MESKARYCKLWHVFLTLASTVSKAGPYRAGVESQDLYWSKRMSRHRAWPKKPRTCAPHCQDEDPFSRLARHCSTHLLCTKTDSCKSVSERSYTLFLECDRWISSMQTSQTKLKQIRVSDFRRFKTDMSAVMSARCSRVLIQTFHRSEGYWVNMLHCLHYLTSTQNLQTVQMSAHQNKGWRLIIAEDKML